VGADIVIVGGGPAGLAAAVTAADLGARVLLLEKADHLGGNCLYSGGNLVETGVDHLEALCFGRTGRAVLEAYAGGLAVAETWLRSLGARTVTLPQMGPHAVAQCWPHLPGADGVRYYWVLGEPPPGFGISAPSGGPGAGSGTAPGRALADVLTAAVAARPIQVLLSTPATDLLMDGAAVTGVVAGSLSLRADAVILTTGGFENAPAMCDTYLPAPSATVLGHLDNTGDGTRLARRAGADLWHMSNWFGWWAFRSPDHRAGFGMGFREPGHLFVDVDGRPFGPENGREGHDRLRLLGNAPPTNDNYPHLPAYAVFDDVCRAAGPISSTPNPIGYAWSADNAVEVERGWIVSADGPDALADRLGMDRAVLAATLRRYDEDAGAGRDSMFARPPATMRPLQPSSLYAIAMWPGVATTWGDRRRDARARVLDESGEPIRGLYAAGGNGSVWGHLTQHGGGLTDGLVFGTIAARDAVAT
jgi:glycine/D-amino acid oxidase-like deaminating enzyme